MYWFSGEYCIFVDKELTENIVTGIVTFSSSLYLKSELKSVQ